MKKIYFLSFGILFLFIATINAFSQVGFYNANIRLNNSGHSGCSVAITDWNGDGLDDIIRLDDGQDVYVEVQHTNNTYDTHYLGTFGQGPGWAWAMCVADIDHNGYKDIIAGGYGPAVEIMMVDNNGLNINIVSLPNSGFFLQNLTFGDFNNDGWIDVFCCDDNAAAHLYVNDGTGTLLPSTLIDFALNPTIFYSGDPADAGNYGSVWTDFDNDGDLDLYVAHCRQGVNSPADLRRINRLFVNDGSNNFTESASSYGLDIGWQSWTSSMGDIDNDGDMDMMLTNHDHESQVLQNDGTGHYTDITSTSGFDITDITPIESVMEDFDNDGWIDILAAGSDSRYYKNNGNGTFTKINGLFDNNNMESFSIGDLNHDGSIDIYSSYASIYTTPTGVDDVIWMNKGNSNHFFTLDLKGTISNIDAIGARAYIYGSWGVQTREARAGESYGTVNSTMLHFGLGLASSIDSAVILWPSGVSQTILNPSIDQFLTIKESDCISPEATLTFTGAPILCTGQTLTLTAPANMSYLWSTGDTTQSIVVSAAGEYNVLISEIGNNCPAYSRTLVIPLNPDETPVLTTSGLTEFCDGSSVDIISPSGYLNYAWSNGSSNQNLNVTQSGTYTLTVLGHCQLWTSGAVIITVHPVPADPVPGGNVTLSFPGTATLTATGNTPYWYDVPAGGVALGTGISYTTPVLYDTTVFYVEAANTYGGGIFLGGKPFHTGTSQFSSDNSTNATTIFDVTEACTLQSVKVYTDMAGYRTIELRDNNGTLVNSSYVNILPDTQIITLNWFLPVGNNFTIGTNGTTNIAIPNWGNVSPRLKRNSGDVSYPYNINGMVDINNSSVGSTYYYYFYDWQVEKQTKICPSNRLPVTVNVNSSVGISEASNSTISIYPNPATEKVWIKTGNFSDATISVYDFTARLVKTEKLKGNSQWVDISTLSKGIYSLKVQFENTQFVYKLMVD